MSRCGAGTGERGHGNLKKQSADTASPWTHPPLGGERGGNRRPTLPTQHSPLGVSDWAVILFNFITSRYADLVACRFSFLLGFILNRHHFLLHRVILP